MVKTEKWGKVVRFAAIISARVRRLPAHRLTSAPSFAVQTRKWRKVIRVAKAE
jgi:hypothetical protein